MITKTMLSFGDIITNGVNHWIVVAYHWTKGALLCEKCGGGINQKLHIIISPIVLDKDEITPLYILPEKYELESFIDDHPEQFRLYLMSSYKSFDPTKWKERS